MPVSISENQCCIGKKTRPRSKSFFKNWNGFHDDALNSRGFKQEEKPSATNAAAEKTTKTASSKPADAEFEVDYDKWTADWSKKFNPEQVAEIRSAVERNLDDYLYLRQFCEQISNSIKEWISKKKNK